MPRWLAPILVVSYPALIYLASHSWSPKALGIGLVVSAVVWRFSAGDTAISRGLVCGGVLLAALAFGFNDVLPLKLYPVMVSGLLLVVFAASLWFPPTVVERIARLQNPSLSQEAVRYTRRVTQVWCLFFVSNGLIALWTALWQSARVWFWYNGVIAYLLIGSLFAGEWVVRRRVREKQRG
jgi:uncharacterized membrane protein